VNAANEKKRGKGDVFHGWREDQAT
jgi:hypothetical protein